MSATKLFQIAHYVHIMNKIEKKNNNRNLME